MFKAVYFHKTVRAAEVMLIEALRLSDDEFGFTTFNLDEFVKLTDEYVVITSYSIHYTKLYEHSSCQDLHSGWLLTLI